MTQTMIRAGDGVMTLINVFTVAPQRQQELVDILAEATDRVMVAMPGFISANIHRSDDGTHVVNYAQWRSRDDFAAMLADEQAREHMGPAAALASFEPIVCEVVSVHHV